MDHPQRNQQDGGHDADLRVGWQKADDECGNRYHYHGELQGVATAQPVAHEPKQHTSHRPHDHANGQRGIARQQPGDWVRRGKELRREIAGKKGIDREVIEFDGIADGTCQHDPRRGCVFRFSAHLYPHQCPGDVTAYPGAEYATIGGWRHR